MSEEERLALELVKIKYKNTNFDNLIFANDRIFDAYKDFLDMIKKWKNK